MAQTYSQNWMSRSRRHHIPMLSQHPYRYYIGIYLLELYKTKMTTTHNHLGTRKQLLGTMNIIIFIRHKLLEIGCFYYPSTGGHNVVNHRLRFYSGNLVVIHFLLRTIKKVPTLLILKLFLQLEKIR